jgi:hypothetical protein
MEEMKGVSEKIKELDAEQNSADEKVQGRL